jgi:hypothetical protein
MTTVVAFDESGNTGDNLLDEIQPIYSLTSVAIPEDEAERVVADVGAQADRELKYSDLRRLPRVGQMTRRGPSPVSSRRHCRSALGAALGGRARGLS